LGQRVVCGHLAPQAHQVVDFLDPVNAEGHLPVKVQNGSIDRIPPSLHENAAAIAKRVALARHHVGLPASQYPFQRRSQVSDAVRFGMAGIVREDVEQFPSQILLACRARRPEPRFVCRDDDPVRSLRGLCS
jgi:hypothetical protein